MTDKKDKRSDKNAAVMTVDCRMLGASGVGVYLRECLPFFLDSSHQFVLLGDPQKLAAIAHDAKNAKIIPCAIKLFSFRELLAFPHSLLTTINQTGLFYSPYFNIPDGITVPVFTTIHDIIFPDMPELTSPLGLAARMWFYRRAFKKSKKIFTVSEFSKSRIEHFLGTDTPVTAIPNGYQSYLIPRVEAGKTKTIVFIGNIKKHKGLSYLLDAFFNTWKAGLDYRLIIVGNKNNFRSSDSNFLKNLENLDSSAIEFTGFISDEQLKVLLTQAALLVQPSLYEGFGFPPLEAMICGTRALISDIPVFREIYADFPVVFFRAGDSKDLADKLMDLLYNKQTERISLPSELAGKYTFEKTARKILEALEC